jgi:hypothetical protein
LRAAQKLRKPGQDEDDSRPGKNVDLATTTINDIQSMQMNDTGENAGARFFVCLTSRYAHNKTKTTDKDDHEDVQ